MWQHCCLWRVRATSLQKSPQTPAAHFTELPPPLGGQKKTAAVHGRDGTDQKSLSGGSSTLAGLCDAPVKDVLTVFNLAHLTPQG